MRKIVSLALCLLLLLSAYPGVCAAASAHMSLSASDSELYRGESFTIYVSLSNDQVVGRGAIVLNYDSSVFEFIGGSCSVSGATLAEVSAGRNGGVFALSENRVVSGNIFTINMRVKDTATFGTYTISGNASMDIPCSAGSVSLKVSCKHQFAAYKTDDTSTHSRKCTICNQVEKANHTWDNGRITVAATCRSTGKKLYTCTACSTTKEETIPISNTHNYTNWKKNTDTTHQATCSLCGKQEYFLHTWNDGTIIKEATCTTTGEKNIQCADCGFASTAEIPVLEHRFTPFEKVDDASHTHECILCGLIESSNHTYTDNYSHDPHFHYLICDDCGNQKESADHVPGAAATDDTPQTCTVCSRVLKPAGNHIHHYVDTWSMDQTGHWYSCDSCDEQSGLRFHEYTNSCDPSCDICGYERVPTHDFSADYTSDASGHWHSCSGCDAISGKEVHTPNGDATISSASVCTVCSWEIEPKIEHDHNYDPACHFHACVCGEGTEITDEANCPICSSSFGWQLRNFPWWLICIFETVALLALGSYLIILKKRR